MSRMRLIVHPSDFSTASRPAFARALETAKERRAELLVAHVIPPVIPAASDGYISAATYGEMIKTSRADAQRRLDRLVGAARKAGVRARGMVREGGVWDQIVRLARAQKADLIVMGTHGRTGLTRMLVGSVAERVIGHAPCPVLTVRART
jgi:nucleotide-binding universal stress UspA family protein